jgi:alkanesulfonate monooxygenase SsuD/methylene tetrahydromethanopterin reductase-like flavin-dependent oxidoreductase (luciferase family)
MDDYIRAMRALWSMDHPEHHGPFVSFSGVAAYPRPVQQPGPPIVVGGESGSALRRAVTMAEGWYGFNVGLKGTGRCLDALREVAGRHDRPAELGRLEISVTPVGTIDRAAVEQYEQLGVDRLVLLPQPDADRADRHRSVPIDRILHNIDVVADQIIGI